MQSDDTPVEAWESREFSGVARFGNYIHDYLSSPLAIDKSKSLNGMGVSRRWRFDRRWQTPVLIARRRSSAE